MCVESGVVVFKCFAMMILSAFHPAKYSVTATSKGRRNNSSPLANMISRDLNKIVTFKEKDIFTQLLTYKNCHANIFVNTDRYL